MPSAMMGKAAALSIVDMIQHGATGPTHSVGMAHIGGATCQIRRADIFCSNVATSAVQPV